MSAPRRAGLRRTVRDIRKRKDPDYSESAPRASRRRYAKAHQRLKRDTPKSDGFFY